MRTVTGMAATTPDGPLQPWTFQRRDLRPDDVAVRVTFCGVCHSDLDAVAHVGDTPLVPGHEFVGEVTEVGADVTRFAVGDPVAVGNIIDSCRVCDSCRAGHQNACERFPALTYGGRDLHDGSPTQGAYSTGYVLSNDFVYALPAGLDPAGVAPLMCAGATVFAPLRRLGVGPGQRVGVVGLGGLGHLAVKMAAALGAHVVSFTRSAGRAAGARAMGAAEVVLSTDPAQVAAQSGRLDVVLDTAPGSHDLTPYLLAVARGGTLCLVGLGPQVTLDPLVLLMGGARIEASGSAGIGETQEMLDFCAEHGITADVEVLPLAEVGTAFARLAAGDAAHRFVLDVAGPR